MKPKSDRNKFVLVFMFLVFEFFLGFFIAKAAHADTYVITTLSIKHIPSGIGNTYNEGFGSNPSIGLQFTDGLVDSALVYVNKNSHNQESLYGYITKHCWTNNKFKLGYGLMLATGGYDSDVIGMPYIAVQYEWLQFKTSYPAARVSGAPADLAVLTLAIPL